MFIYLFLILFILYGTFDTADDVEPVVLLAAHVEGDERHEAGDLHEEVHQQRHTRV